ncbi:MAG TPA: hypothetical protein VKX17_12645 [Planctomycetota bacterium]|nr:hypothetical protein [Planctomycetota bacterium]
MNSEFKNQYVKWMKIALAVHLSFLSFHVAFAGEAGGDDAQKLLAEKERKTGPTFPGKDPAFLILPRPLERSETERELLTPQVREMTEKALAYLAHTQDADGAWSDAQFPSNTGVTALAALAFMAEGSQPRAGRFGKPIDRGMEFLLKNVQSGGAIAGKGSNPLGPMYEHTFSTLALLYAAGDMPWLPGTRDVIAKAIQVTSHSQLLDGGWRYPGPFKSREFS